MNHRTLATVALVLTSVWASAQAQEWQATGYLGLDSRGFWEDELFAGQEDGFNTSLHVRPEFYWRSDDGRQRISVVGFARLDSEDDEREHVDLREAYWGYEGDGWDVNAGINKVFWGVAESRHLVDVINQTDLVEDIDHEDKLGQPMVNVNLDRDFGRFELYLMPRFRERTFPGVNGRFRTALPIDNDEAIYESSNEDRQNDVAFRYSHYFGDVDVGAYLFDGTSREPGLAVAPEGDRLIPVYEQMTQVGLDLQYTREAWLWKLEVVRRDAVSDTFNAAVGGLEYTFYGVGGRVADLGLLFEYLWDDRDVGAPSTPFDDDIFVGTRLALNDSSDTSLLAGAVVDTETGETFLNLEAERRIGDNVTVDLRLRAFSNAESGEALYAFEQDDYLQLRVSWYY